MCKLLYFVQMMSYVASIMTLTFIAMERYFAILHPLRCKTWKRLWLLRVAVGILWLTSAASGFPQLIYRDTLTTPDGVTFCIVNGPEFNRYAYVLTNFVLWYIIPLLIIVVLYSKISIVLWNTSKLDRPSSNALRGWRREKKIKYTYKSSKYPTSTTNGQTFNTDVRISIEDELPDRSNSSPRSSLDEGRRSLMDEGLQHPSSFPDVDNGHSDKSGILRSVSKKEPSSFSSQKRLLPLKDMVPPRKGSNAKPNHLSPLGPEMTSALQDFTSDTTTASGVTLSDSYASVEMTDKAVTPENQSLTPRRRSSENEQLANKVQRPFVSQTWTWNRSEAALRARRRVIRLLMAVAISFALCVLPYHIQMIINEWGIQRITFAHMFRNQITSLIFYFNSALNPILYAFLSDNFRKSLKELLPCQKCRSSSETSGKKLSTKPVEYRRNGNSTL